MLIQTEFDLSAKSRGFHLVTEEVIRHLPPIQQCRIGLLHLFIKHTSASLSLNENADKTVRDDLEEYLKRAVPDGEAYYTHTYEGPDDITAHIKHTLIGSHISIPITQGHLNLGIWQGIYLCEHRHRAPPRTLVATINGEHSTTS